MRAEEILNKMIISFFVITTGIVFSMYIFCLIFNPNAKFTLNDIGRILLMAVAGDLPFVILLSSRELNKKQMILRIIIHVVVLSAILLLLAICWEWVNPKSLTEIAVFLLTVMMVYAVVLFVGNYRASKLTDKLNKRLKERYRS